MQGVPAGEDARDRGHVMAVHNAALGLSVQFDAQFLHEVVLRRLTINITTGELLISCSKSFSLWHLAYSHVDTTAFSFSGSADTRQ